MLDEESADPVPGTSGNKTIETKPKKKAVPAKKKADKEAAPVKKAEKSAAASKKGNNEAVPAKKVDKDPSKKADKAAEPPKDKKKPMLDLVCDAIKVLGDGKKGASVPAIKKYVSSIGDSVPPNFNSMINKALAKGIEKGILARPSKSKDAKGAVGHFCLAKIDAPKPTVKKERRQKTDKEHASDSETIEKPAKKMKRNLSDTYIAEMKNSLTSTPKPVSKQAATSKKILVKQTKEVPKKTVTEKDTSDSKKSSKKLNGTKATVKKLFNDAEVKGTKPAGTKGKVKKLFNDAEAKGTKPAKKAKKQ